MKIKRFINSVLACAMVCTAVPYVSYSVSENISITANAVDYTEGTYESLTYKAYADYVEISDCDTSATEVVIPSEIESLPVTTIGEQAFRNCSKLKSIIFPNSIKSIGELAFYNCSYLKSITLPESLTNISNCAFGSCYNLTEITIPESVTSIGNSAFVGCYSLKKLIIPNNVSTIGNSAFEYCSDLISITISKNIINIESYTFSHCASLTSITIPDNVTSIGKEAFSYCEDLKSINISDSVTSIGEDAFRYCSNLEKITIENPDCVFNTPSIPSTATIYGYNGSTAQTYAEQNGNEFAVIGSSENSGIKGDANGDGTVDVADVVAISAYVGDSKNNSLDEQNISNGDVQNTGDGLTANDALMIQQYLSGNITTLE